MISKEQHKILDYALQTHLLWQREPLKVLLYIPGSAGEYFDMNTGNRFQLSLVEEKKEIKNEIQE